MRKIVSMVRLEALAAGYLPNTPVTVGADAGLRMSRPGGDLQIARSADGQAVITATLPHTAITVRLPADDPTSPSQAVAILNAAGAFRRPAATRCDSVHRVGNHLHHCTKPVDRRADGRMHVGVHTDTLTGEVWPNPRPSDRAAS